MSTSKPPHNPGLPGSSTALNPGPRPGNSGVIRISDLRELRELRRMTQERLAELLGTSQGTISKLERRRPPALRDLKHFVEAMGGELSLVARFPTQAVELVLGEDKPPSSR